MKSIVESMDNASNDKSTLSSQYNQRNPKLKFQLTRSTEPAPTHQKTHHTNTNKLARSVSPWLNRSMNSSALLLSVFSNRYAMVFCTASRNDSFSAAFWCSPGCNGAIPIAPPIPRPCPPPPSGMVSERKLSFIAECCSLLNLRLPIIDTAAAAETLLLVCACCCAWKAELPANGTFCSHPPRSSSRAEESEGLLVMITSISRFCCRMVRFLPCWMAFSTLVGASPTETGRSD